jgi:hypothetical protein
VYYEQSMRRTHETKLRFSDKEAADIQRLVETTGGQKAEILRTLIMEALASKDDISQDSSNLEVAQ